MSACRHELGRGFNPNPRAYSQFSPRAPSRSRKRLRLAYDSLRLASRLAVVSTAAAQAGGLRRRAKGLHH